MVRSVRLSLFLYSNSNLLTKYLLGSQGPCQRGFSLLKAAPVRFVAYAYGWPCLNRCMLYNRFVSYGLHPVIHSLLA